MNREKFIDNSLFGSDDRITNHDSSWSNVIKGTETMQFLVIGEGGRGGGGGMRVALNVARNSVMNF